MKTAFSIPINPNLVWDYPLDQKRIKKESFLLWYLSRALTHGTAKDIRQIPRFVLRKYFHRLTLPKPVAKFWQWYLTHVDTNKFSDNNN